MSALKLTYFELSRTNSCTVINLETSKFFENMINSILNVAETTGL